MDHSLFNRLVADLEQTQLEEYGEIDHDAALRIAAQNYKTPTWIATRTMMLKVGDTVAGAYGRPFKLQTQGQVKWAIENKYELIEEAKMDMIEEARKIYSEACQGAGEKPAFTKEVAKLVGATASDYEDLVLRFKCERDIMERAYRKAVLLAESMNEEACINCGQMIQQNTKVCPHCGAGSEFQ